MSGTDLFDRPSTADTGGRNAHDYYETPPWMTLSLLAHHPIVGTVFEPCAGDGSIVRVLESRASVDVVLTNDVDPRHHATFHQDAAGLDLWAEPALSGIRWVITNPPFNVAFPILKQAVLLASTGVAMLLRKTFLEPTKERGAWLRTHPPSRIIGLPRHSFRGNGSDSVSADWIIWERGERDVPPIVIDHLAKSRKATS